MRQKLFEVPERGYTVSGLLVLAARAEKESLNCKAGDSIILIKPDGSEIETQAVVTDRFKVNKLLVHTVLVKDLKKEEIPIDTINYLEVSK